MPSAWAWLWAALAVATLAMALWQAEDDASWTPSGDQSVHLMATMSLWHDQDLRYTLEDLARFDATYPAADGPRGIFLKQSQTGQVYYAKPFLYALASTPFYGLMGIRGFVVLNFLALCALALMAFRCIRAAVGTRQAHLLTMTFFAFSPYVAWLSVIHPDLMLSAMLCAAGYRLLTATTPAALVAGGVLLGLCIYEKPTFVLLAPFLLLARRQQTGRWPWIVLAGLLLAWLIPTSVNLAQDGQLLNYQGVRYYALNRPFPLEAHWQASRPMSYNHVFDWHEVLQALPDHARLLPEKWWDSLIGRQTGLLVYHPVALVLIALALRSPRRAAPLLWGLALYHTLNLLAVPNNGFGGAQSYGSRYLMQALSMTWLALLPGQTPAAPRPMKAMGFCAAAACMLLAATMQHQVWPPSPATVGRPETFLLSEPARRFPLESSLLPSSPIPPALFSVSNADGSVQVFLVDGFEQGAIDLDAGKTRARVTIYRQDRLGTLPVLLSTTAAVDALVQHQGHTVWQGPLRPGEVRTIPVDESVFSSRSLDLMSLAHRRWGSLDITLNAGPATPGQVLLKLAPEAADNTRPAAP